jgi:hypothetical protein
MEQGRRLTIDENCNFLSGILREHKPTSQTEKMILATIVNEKLFGNHLKFTWTYDPEAKDPVSETKLSAETTKKLKQILDDSY